MHLVSLISTKGFQSDKINIFYESKLFWIQGFWLWTFAYENKKDGIPDLYR